jgi:hypothetical protein
MAEHILAYQPANMFCKKKIKLMLSPAIASLLK